MNRFVLIAEEEYDCYSVEVPYPFETELSLEEIRKQLLEFAEACLVAEEVNRSRQTAHDPYIRLKDASFDGCKAAISAWSSLRWKQIDGGSTEPYPYPARVLTIDEWFATIKEEEKG